MTRAHMEWPKWYLANSFYALMMITFSSYLGEVSFSSDSASMVPLPGLYL